MSQPYVPELGQAFYGAPWSEYELGDIGEAAVAFLLREIERVFWNRQQRGVSFQSEEDAEAWNALASGIEWHAYWWGDDEAPEASRPNLSFDGLNIRWYKYPGRGESCERSMAPEEWAAWLSKALEAARSADRDIYESA